MNISKKDMGLLMLLGSIVVIFLVYFFLFNNFLEKGRSISDSNKELQTRVNTLKEHYNNLPTYEQGIADFRTSVQQAIGTLPADVKTEDIVGYLLDVEAKQGLALNEISFSEPTLINSFPGKMQKDGEDVTVNMEAYRVGATANGALTYPQLKAVLDALYRAPSQTTLDSVTVSYDTENANLAASFALAKYYVTYEDAQYTPVQLPVVRQGVPNPFGATN